MSRSISVDNVTAATGEVIRPVILLYADFESGPVRCHSGIGTLTFDGESWFGVGNLGGIGPVKETTQLEAGQLAVAISGVDEGNRSRMLGENYQGREIIIYHGFLQDDLLTFEDDPFIVFRGTMDNATITLGETGSISIACRSRLDNWDKPKVGRYNHATQITRFPNDKGLQFVEQAAEKEIQWGPGLQK